MTKMQGQDGAQPKAECQIHDRIPLPVGEDFIASISPNLAVRDLIGVVIPAFGHPQFLSEALSDIFSQTIIDRLRIVIIDDGCHYRETSLVARQSMTRSFVYYLRQPNRKLPSARNTGVKFLLAAHPDITAFYFLDADNRLASYALEAFETTLKQTPEAGWAYPDINFFGLGWDGEGADLRELAPQFSILKQLMGNVSEAGSMVRSELFHHNIWFDSDMRDGFEDWDFWLSALEKGYSGVRALYSGFYYRHRPESMLSESRRHEAGLIAHLKRKHHSLYDLRFLVSLLHREAPFFAFINTVSLVVRLTGDPFAPGRIIPLDHFMADLKKARQNPKEFFVPPFIFAGPKIDDLYQNKGLFIRDILRSFCQHYTASQCQHTVSDIRALKIISGNYIRFDFPPEPVVPTLSHFLVFTPDSLFDLSSLVLSSGHFSFPEIHALCPGYRSLQKTDYTDHTERLHGHTESSLISAESDPWAKDFITSLESLTGPPMRYQDHHNRHYYGPDVADLHQVLLDPATGVKGLLPYPLMPQKKPSILVCIDAQKLESDIYARAVCQILDTLSHAGFILRLAFETLPNTSFSDKFCQYLISHFSHRVIDCVQIIKQEEQDEYQPFLGRRLSVDFTQKHKEHAILKCQTADAILCLGATALLSLFGDMKRSGVQGYVLADPPFTAINPLKGSDIDRILAFEHVEKAIICQNPDLKSAMIAEGIPAEKLITLHQMADQINHIVNNQPNRHFYDPSFI